MAVAAGGDDRHDSWHRVTTPDFEMLSDLAPPDALALADRLTRFRIAAQALLGQQELSSPSPRMIAFRSARAFRQVFALRNISGVTLSSISRYTLAFGPDGLRGYDSGALTAFHEYSHYLMQNNRQMNYPAWWEEGYANFLSTMYAQDDGVVVGHVPPIRRRQMVRSRPSLEELFDDRIVFDWKRRDLEGVYLKAWLLVHMLQLGHLSGLPPFHERVPEMLAKIDAGESTRVAVETSLGVDLPALERTLNAYTRRISLPKRTVVVDVEHETPMDVQPLTVAEARHALANAAAAAGNVRHAARLFQHVLDGNPDDIDALVGLSGTTTDPEHSLETAERALALDAEHPGANIRMAELNVTRCSQASRDACLSVWRESAEFYRRAVRNDPDNVEAAFGLGVIYLHVGQPGDALGYLRVAHGRAPWVPRINLFLGEGYRLIGDVERARVHLTKAMHWHRDERWRERAALALSMMDSEDGN
ncbi:MAG: tetratricopeptide repeat protein [Gammaproteobacteria bacterium]|nr:tetratricopeptide repeat protein [Gammaproteobacteria bacterium]